MRLPSGEKAGSPSSAVEAQDAVTVRRVYGEPYERNDVTVILAARVAGGGGGGRGEHPSGRGSGSGGGFGIGARPVPRT